MSIAIAMFIGCNSKKSDNKSPDENQIGLESINSESKSEKKEVNSLIEQAKKSGNDFFTTAKLVKESGYTVMSLFEQMDEKLFNLKNDHARIFSFRFQNSTFIIVVFNKEEPSINMQAFLDITEAVGEDLAKRYQGGYLLAYSPEDSYVKNSSIDYNNVMTYYGGTAEQIFVREGIRFYVNDKEIAETDGNNYRSALAEIIKKKRNKNNLTDWDFFMFRNKLPEPEKKDDVQIGNALLGSSAFIEVLRMDWKRLINTATSSGNPSLIQTFLKMPEERENAKIVMEHSVYGIVWFDLEGRRVMAETLTKDDKTGKIIKERRWYNGYSEPK